MQIQQMPIEALIPYIRNPRKNDSEVDRMCSAIREFGFRIPVVAKSDGSVIDGHLRLKAAIKLGMQTVPVAIADELTDAQIKAFRLLANKSANWAKWDDELLKLELEELDALGFDLEMTGFDTPELTLAMGFGADFEPGTEDDQGKLDEKDPTICPACGHEFHK